MENSTEKLKRFSEIFGEFDVRNEMEFQLHSLLKTMKVPELRKDVSKKENLFWLSRNLGINNGSHPNFKAAQDLIKDLIFRSR